MLSVVLSELVGILDVCIRDRVSDPSVAIILLFIRPLSGHPLKRFMMVSAM